jgi:hypothetical protein
MSLRHNTTLSVTAAMARSMEALSAAADDEDCADAASGAIAPRTRPATISIETRPSALPPEPAASRGRRALTAGPQLLTIWDI